MLVTWSISAQDSESRRVTLVPHSPLAICLATGEKRAMNRRHEQKETRANSASPGDDPSVHPCQNHFVSIVGCANGSLYTGETTDVLLIGSTALDAKISSIHPNCLQASANEEEENLALQSGDALAFQFRPPSIQQHLPFKMENLR